MIVVILRRVLAAIPVLVVVAVFVFALLRLAGGDPATVIAGDMATPEQLAAIRAKLGLDQSLATQFITWIREILAGDLGISLISGAPVARLIGQRLEPTLSLALVAIMMTVIVAVPLGVLAAWRHGGWLDKLVSAATVLGFSVPVFVVGYLLIEIFSRQLQWLPVQGFQPISAGPSKFISSIILPALTLSSVYVALIARMTRASMLDVLGEDFVRTAHAKGLSERIVLFRHALRNAAVPILTVIGTGFALMITGVVITESVFNIPGLGRLTVDAILARDYPVIQALILLTSAVYVVINLLIDLSYAALDPRIRH